jgi:ATP phosphoribosyltransferase regulatory subunit
MANRRWLLPEAIEDVLPRDAARIEALRRALLDEFSGNGYEFVIPPMLEYVESLLTGSGHDLDLRTFKLVDQLSGRSMGSARRHHAAGGAHRCASAESQGRYPAVLLRQRPAYAAGGLQCDARTPADRCRTLRPCRIGSRYRGDPLAGRSPGPLRHQGFAFRPRARGGFSCPCQEGWLGARGEEELFGALQGKDVPAVRELLSSVADPVRSALLALPELYGDRQVLARAAKTLPALPEIAAALSDLQRLADALADLPLSFDLADLRGYHYHSGVVFAAYCAGSPAAVALGGRYDDFGRTFGRARPATGFSMDLRELARLSPDGEPRGAILAPWPEDDAMHAEAMRLRAQGERVVLALPGHDGTWREAGCDRILVRSGDNWIIESLKED